MADMDAWREKARTEKTLCQFDERDFIPAPDPAKQQPERCPRCGSEDPTRRLCIAGDPSNLGCDCCSDSFHAPAPRSQERGLRGALEIVAEAFPRGGEDPDEMLDALRRIARQALSDQPDSEEAG